MGCTLFLGFLLPAILMLTKSITNTKTRDKIIAVELLEGEFSIIKKYDVLPPRSRTVKINDATYTILCDTLIEQEMLKWKMTVYRNKDSLTSVYGLLPLLSDSTNENIENP